MKNNEKLLSNYRIKLAVLCLLMIFATACIVSQSKENKQEKTDGKTETVKKKSKSGDTLKDKSKTEKTSSSGTDDLKKKVCKKFDSCGCQDYDDCMAELEENDFSDEVLQCLLKSSCKSLCAGDPDGCKKSGDTPKTKAPDVPSCSRISCTKNGDCPGGCTGGCIDGYCSLF